MPRILKDLKFRPRDFLTQELSGLDWCNRIPTAPQNETGDLDRMELFPSLVDPHSPDQYEPANQVGLV